MKTDKNLLIIPFALLLTACMAEGQPVAARIGRDAIISVDGIVLNGNDRLSTPGSFRPPVDITIVAKTESANLRMAYAADQIIFNWETNPGELRVDGGPAGGVHKSDAGEIPKDKYVLIKWVVTAKKQSIYVDKELRYEHEGDYSQIDSPVSVFAAGSKVTVKSITVRQALLLSN